MNLKLIRLRNQLNSALCHYLPYTEMVLRLPALFTHFSLLLKSSDLFVQIIFCLYFFFLRYNALSQKSRFQSVRIAALRLYNIQRKTWFFKNSLCRIPCHGVTLGERVLSRDSNPDESPTSLCYYSTSDYSCSAKIRDY